MVRVVWQYTCTPQLHLPNDLFKTYREVFTNPPWAGTAFKGATSSCAQIPNTPHYVGNHLSWIELINQLSVQDIEVSGIVLTGWQRFDHFATLCELLPVALPSLKCCLTAIEKRRFNEEDAAEVFSQLGLSKGNLTAAEDDMMAVPSSNTWPGHDLYKLVVNHFGK